MPLTCTLFPFGIVTVTSPLECDDSSVPSSHVMCFVSPESIIQRRLNRNLLAMFTVGDSSLLSSLVCSRKYYAIKAKSSFELPLIGLDLTCATLFDCFKPTFLVVLCLLPSSLIGYSSLFLG